ncbi:hypothetical protein A9Q86_02490 [Flavobacteriales bacterium 33_180_T64]|nr:hypothetical protein A9Q86_02490 [Flavobacteriales bacterium 33_180_T64]
MAILKIYRRKDFFKDIIIITLIVLSPLITYVHLKFPETKTLETSLFTINSNYYGDIQALVWTISIKLAYILTFSFWFLTCKHWWRFGLLIPLIFYINQLMIVINDEIYYVDNKELKISFIISIPIILLLLFISKKLNYYSKSKSLAEDLDAEIKLLFKEASLINKKDFKDTKLEVAKLRLEKDNLSPQEYLTKLIALRDSLN